MKNKKVIKIYGGLGNQLFQLSFAIYLKNLVSNKTFLDINEFEYINHHSGFQLSKLLKIDFPLLNFLEHIKFKFFKRLSSRSNFYLKQNEKSANKIPSKDKIYQSRYFDGYWQNLTMVDSVIEELISYLKPIDHGKLKILDNYIAIHVRRGDYLLDEDMYLNICDKNYYKKAVNYFEDNLKNPKFFIFSDDIDWCKSNFSFIKNHEFIDYNKSALEDFILMIGFKNKIISNSTFSWWSAMLNSQSKIIIAPKVWNNIIEYDDFIPEKWIKI